MPIPNKNELEDNFIERCIPFLRKEGNDQKQAVAICYSIFKKSRKLKEYKMKSFKSYLDEGIVSSVAAFGFVKKLSTSFEKWDEFKNGIIDKDGRVINKTKKISIFNDIARKIRILFLKFVPNKKYFALLVAMYLIRKEDVSDPLEDLVKEELDNRLSEEEKFTLIDILNEVSNASKSVGNSPKKYFKSEKFFVGRNLSDEDARKIGIKRIRYDHRSFCYNSKSGYCKFV